MNLDDIYEQILPYLSNPKALKELLEELRTKEEDELIAEINKRMTDSTSSFKTDLKILINVLEKQG